MRVVERNPEHGSLVALVYVCVLVCGRILAKFREGFSGRELLYKC